MILLNNHKKIYIIDKINTTKTVDISIKRNTKDGKGVGMKVLKKEKGITLIALVITIIVLLILVSITIATLTGENGILTKASIAKDETKKAQYKEEIELIITEKKIEKLNNINETRKLIELVAEGIREKKWQKDVTICDEYENEDIDSSQGVIIIVETKDDYEIIVEIKEELISIEINKMTGEAEILTIKFEANGGEGTVPEEITKKKGRSIRLPGAENLSKENYKFVGWSENESEAPENVSLKMGSIFKPTSSTTIIRLYAIWAYDTKEIRFDSNGGTGTMESINVVTGKNTNLPSNKFTREGYKFKEWNTKSDGSGTRYSNEGIIMTTENMSLYAIWDIMTYTVTYNANGGIGAPLAQTKYYGQPLTLSSTKPTRSGYTFVNWAGSDGKTYEAGASYTGNAEVTLTAQWKEGPVALKDKITNLNYGDDVVYSSGGVSDWVIFDVYNGKIRIISKYLVPVDKLTVTANVVTKDQHQVSSSTKSALSTWLNNGSYWRSFAQGIPGSSAKRCSKYR